MNWISFSSQVLELDEEPAFFRRVEDPLERLIDLSPGPMIDRFVERATGVRVQN